MDCTGIDLLRLEYRPLIGLGGDQVNLKVFAMISEDSNINVSKQTQHNMS